MFLPTYRFLNRKIRMAGLPIWQWAQVLVGLLIAFLVSRLLAVVMPSSWAMSIAITIAGMPLAAAIVAMEADFDVPAYLRAAVSWKRGPKLLLPGTDPAGDYAGYQLTTAPDAAPAVARAAGVALTPTDMEDMWDRS